MVGGTVQRGRTQRALSHALNQLRFREFRDLKDDPYLNAVFKRSGAVAKIDVEEPWHTGHETQERWLTLSGSGVRLRCLTEGFVLSPPQDGASGDGFAEVMKVHNVDAGLLLLRIPQELKEGVLYDTQDRVQIGAALVRDLVAMKPV